MDAPKTHEEMAERIGIWWEGHNEGARKQLAKYVLAALNEATAALREENARLAALVQQYHPAYLGLPHVVRERDEARKKLARCVEALAECFHKKDCLCVAKALAAAKEERRDA